MSPLFKAYIGIYPAFQKDEDVIAILTALCNGIGMSLTHSDWSTLTFIGKVDAEMGPSTAYAWTAFRESFLSAPTGKGDLIRSSVVGKLQSYMSTQGTSGTILQKNGLSSDSIYTVEGFEPIWLIQEGRHGPEPVQLSVQVQLKVLGRDLIVTASKVADFTYEWRSSTNIEQAGSQHGSSGGSHRGSTSGVISASGSFSTALFKSSAPIPPTIPEEVD
jgi:hypothetical protein